MIELKLKTGETVTYDKPFDMKDDKYLVKFRIVRDGEGEGPWVRLHPDDFEDHEKDVRDDKVRLAVMSNDCLCGVPWLCLTPYRMQGDKRPECNMNELMDLESEPVYVDLDKGTMKTAEEYAEWREAAAARDDS